MICFFALVGFPCIFTCQRNRTEINVHYPFDKAVFPPEIRAPKMWWEDGNNGVDAWQLCFHFRDGQNDIVASSDSTFWTPDQIVWETIKQRGFKKGVRVTIEGIGKHSGEDEILSRGRFQFFMASDSVGAPIFYRDVPLPFMKARQNLHTIKWRLGDVASYDSTQIVMENLPACANCHSFSADGATLGMDFDFANDKGGYIITPFDTVVSWSQDQVVSWTDYDARMRNPTFGLLSSLSPDGRYIISTVRDRSVFLDQFDLYFTQLFFPVQGILAYYDMEKKVFQDLPGASDPEFVQSNGSWSPDGKTIVFARARAHKFKVKSQYQGATLVRPEAAEVLGGDEYVYEKSEGRNKWLFDLYRVPFNDGKGGTPEPIPGASENGMSNFFAKYSPDGKWIIFTQAPSYMLNQQGSELYIMPARGGKPRRMRCNTSRMNSWHSWSPNSRWLVFSSKEFSPYTQLFITHIDENGNDSPPVLLQGFTASDRAANIPEFVNIKPGSKRRFDTGSISKEHREAVQ